MSVCRPPLRPSAAETAPQAGKTLLRLTVASVIGAIGSNLGGLFLLGGMEVMGGASEWGFTVFPIIFAALLAYYARAMSKKGVLG